MVDLFMKHTSVVRRDDKGRFTLCAFILWAAIVAASWKYTVYIGSVDPWTVGKVDNTVVSLIGLVVFTCAYVSIAISAYRSRGQF